MNHAMDIASSIIANQKLKETMQPLQLVQKEANIPVVPRKQSKIFGPDTQILIASNQAFNLISEMGVPGGIDEIVIKSTDTNFAIEIQIDGKIAFDKTYDELANVSRQSDYISAYTDKYGVETLRIGEVTTWNKSVKVIIKSTGSTIHFNQIYAKHHIYGE